MSNKNIERLRAAVDHLEVELGGVDSLDDETRALLETVGADIQSMLAKSNPPPAAHESLLERLSESVEVFEVAHPRLAAAVRQLMDGLSQLGI